ncbi:hypothetical protein H6504_02140 [Candidatus Woesearchaeota archaeon]|nr:hypothetical protein [Candidatus Woesearchaeota archaeon]
MIFLLRCPGCGNTMKYAPSDNKLLGKSKRCVYCGRSFKVTAAIQTTTPK